MTKADVSTIKKIIGNEYTTYFVSKTRKLRIRVYSYINNDRNEEERTNAIFGLIDKIKNTPFTVSIEERTYQGFIHDTIVIVE